MRKNWRKKDGERSLEDEEDERKWEMDGRRRRGGGVDDGGRRRRWVTGERSEMVVEKED